MRILGLALLCMMTFSNAAFGGIFDDILEGAKAKQVVKVDLPLSAIKAHDARVNKIEDLAIKVAMKKHLVLNLHCPSGKYCSKLKKSLDTKAWKVARAMTSSDYAAKGKVIKIKLVHQKSYSLALWTKGLN